MLENIRKNVLSPLATRLGTGTSLLLVGYGWAEHEASILGAAVTVLLGVGIDLMSDWLRKRAIVNKVKADG